jgi:hypothetical protein
MGFGPTRLGRVVLIDPGAALIAAAAPGISLCGAPRGRGAIHVEDLLAELQSEISETNATLKGEDDADRPTERLKPVRRDARSVR